MTDALQASTATPSANGVYGAQAFFVDLKAGSLLMRHARQSAVTRVFGVPAQDQSLVVTLILIGAAGTVVRGLMPPPWHPSRADAAMGGSLLDATFRGIAGAPSRDIPVAGALIVFALAAHSLRPVVAGTAGQARAMGHRMRHGFTVRYGHNGRRARALR
jgi:hypothetical protein